MKRETKELIDWIKKQISLAGTIVTDVSQPCWQQDRDEAIKFLDSLPEIESHLCRGGYIQDKNGTPCCDGDKVRFKFIEGWYSSNFKDRYTPIMEGKLEFSVETKSFIIIFGPDHNGYDWLDWTDADIGCEWFEKV